MPREKASSKIKSEIDSVEIPHDINSTMSWVVIEGWCADDSDRNLDYPEPWFCLSRQFSIHCQFNY